MTKFIPDIDTLKTLAARVCEYEGENNDDLEAEICVALQYEPLFPAPTNVRVHRDGLQFESQGKTMTSMVPGLTFFVGDAHDLYERFVPNWGYAIKRQPFGVRVTCKMSMDPLDDVECTAPTLACAFLGACLLAIAAQTERDAAKKARAA
ncbi:hypothetical protein LMIY3S_03661 [Labrys miyagiensis]